MVDMENNKMQIPKQSIEWIVNRLHVSVSDDEIATDMRRRIRKNLGVCVTAAAEKRMVAYALKCHHENQGLYGSPARTRDVSRGAILNPIEPRYEIVRRRQSLGHIQWQVWLGEDMVNMFYLRREAIDWILAQEAK